MNQYLVSLKLALRGVSPIRTVLVIPLHPIPSSYRTTILNIGSQKLKYMQT